MAHLLVIGAGLAGSCLTRAARRAGHEVTLVSESEPSTSAAIALLRSGHLPLEDRPLLSAALAAWEALGCAVVRGGMVTSYRTPGAAAAPQKDWYAVDPTDALLTPDVRGRAAYIDGTLVVASSEGLRPLEGDAVVWCTGAQLSGTPPVAGRRTFGHTWLHRNPAALDIPVERDAAGDGAGSLALHHVAPYKVLAGVRYPTGARLGSSSATTAEASLQQALHLLDIARELGWLAADPEDWELVSGMRLARAPFDRLMRQPNGSWSWGGFHRTGFGVAPVEAQHVLAEVLGR